MLISYFWTLGSVIVAGLAWALLNHYSWNILIFVTTIPVAISSLLSFTLLPESPRWLITQGRLKDAEKVIREAARVNGTPLQEFCLSNEEEESAHSSQYPIFDFFKKEPMSISFPLWVVSFAFGFCYYGIILFVSVLFHESSPEGEEEASNSCSFDYSSIFLSAASEFVGVFLTIHIIDRWGRVRTEMVMFLLAALGTALMGVEMSRGALTVTSMCARIAQVSVVSAVWVHSPEVFSTEHRVTGHSIANCLARIGAFLSPYLVESKSQSHQTVGLVLAGVNMVGFFAAILLPETAGRVTLPYAMPMPMLVLTVIFSNPPLPSLPPPLY
jgi:MFS family permease